MSASDGHRWSVAVERRAGMIVASVGLPDRVGIDLRAFRVAGASLGFSGEEELRIAYCRDGAVRLVLQLDGNVTDAQAQLVIKVVYEALQDAGAFVSMEHRSDAGKVSRVAQFSPGMVV